VHGPDSEGPGPRIGGYWQWTLNPYFDIRLAGKIAFLGSRFKGLARLADCNLTVPGVQACNSETLALKVEARFYGG